MLFTCCYCGYKNNHSRDQYGELKGSRMCFKCGNHYQINEDGETIKINNQTEQKFNQSKSQSTSDQLNETTTQ